MMIMSLSGDVLRLLLSLLALSPYASLPSQMMISLMKSSHDVTMLSHDVIMLSHDAIMLSPSSLDVVITLDPSDVGSGAHLQRYDKNKTAQMLSKYDQNIRKILLVWQMFYSYTTFFVHRVDIF